jgi:hypothetical protein
MDSFPFFAQSSDMIKACHPEAKPKHLGSDDEARP